MKLVENKIRYWEFIRSLRNEQVVREGFVQQGHISRWRHFRFMLKNGRHYYICLQADNPIGFVGQIDGDIRVAVDPEHQGRGVGKFMINQIMKLHSGSFAKVKLKNEASIRLFESCGFEKKYYILERD